MGDDDEKKYMAGCCCFVILAISGGLVAMDRSGQAVFPFNSAGMYRGSMDSESDCATRIWPEEGEAGRERKPQPIH